jgi:pimeloyl-ACP methyl ester carboxylesterase
MLVADISRFTMGSDHDVLQEGSFRVPTIYLNDWPDVFIHTNGDVPANLDATKLRRVAVIGAAAGSFLAAVGAEDAPRLALEVFARGAARQADALRRALARGDSGPVTVARFEEARGVVDEAARQEREALSSVATFSPSDAALTRLLGSLKERVSARAAEDRALVARHVAIPAAVVPDDPAARVVPKRDAALVGPMSVYYGDHLLDRLGASPPGDALLHYETLNLVDGRRSAREIRDILSASYGPVASRDVLDYLKVLAKAGVLTLGGR